MSSTEESSAQGDLIAEALQRLSELASEIKDALGSLTGAVQKLAMPQKS